MVDVYAVRDFTSIVRSEDGSFDPSGKLVGVKEFSEAEFAARDIEAIKNPPSNVAIVGDPPSTKELEDLTSGRFKGAIRTLGSADGTVDIYTVRDFSRLDVFGNETLTGVEKCSQAEFDEHTQREMQSKSGSCVVTQE